MSKNKDMKLKKLHYFAGIFILLFTITHLFNHLLSLISIQLHLDFMQQFRLLYRNVLIEFLLFLAISLQIFSGIKLFFFKRKIVQGFFEKLQLWSGLYLAFFFIMHISAILAGRFILKIDTNFYYGVAGLNTFPHLIFFIPYYGLAIFSFFGHLGSIHVQKMKSNVIGLSPKQQAYFILVIGIIITLLILYEATNNVMIPKNYKLM